MNSFILATEVTNPDVSQDLLDWTDRISTLAYLVAALLFILALAGLSKQQSAARGNTFGIAGMTIALVATVFKAAVQSHADPENYNDAWVTILLVAVAMLIGAVIGIARASKVEMTGMPELIAMLHCFVGAAAVLIGVNSFIHAFTPSTPPRPATRSSTSVRSISASSSVPSPSPARSSPT